MLLPSIGPLACHMDMVAVSGEKSEGNTDLTSQDGEERGEDSFSLANG